MSKVYSLAVTFSLPSWIWCSPARACRNFARYWLSVTEITGKIEAKDCLNASNSLRPWRSPNTWFDDVIAAVSSQQHRGGSSVHAGIMVRAGIASPQGQQVGWLAVCRRYHGKGLWRLVGDKYVVWVS